MFILCAAVLAQDNEEARVKAAVEDRYRESIAAANKKDTAAMTNLYDDNAVLMPQSEEAVLGKAAIGEYYKKLFANPDFVPFTLKSDWNSFQLAGDIALAASVFEGDATRNEKRSISTARTYLSGRNSQTVRGGSSAICTTRSQPRNNCVTVPSVLSLNSQPSTLRVVTGH